MATGDFLPLIDRISTKLSSEEKEAALNRFQSAFGNKYSGGDLMLLLKQLVQDNRISPSNTYVLEECLAPSSSTQTEISKLVQHFLKANKKQVEQLKEKENILVRRKELHDLAETVLRNGNGLLLHGDHGVGKTWLARDFINERYQGKAKEVDLREIRDTRVASVEILRQFGFPVSVKDVDLTIFASCLRKTKEKHILYLDNADGFFRAEKENTPNAEEGFSFSEIIENIVNAGKGRIKMLITSRNKSTDVRICSLIRQEQIGHLQSDLAIKLLKNFKMQTMPSQDQLSKAVALCRSLPLNLTLLGGILQDYGTSLEDILDFVQKDAEAVSTILSKLELTEEKETNIYTSSFLKSSFNQLSDTLQKFAVSASLFCRPFSLSSISSVLDTVESCNVKLILHALKHVKLISVIDKPTRQKDIWYDIHPTVREYLQSRRSDSHIASFYQESKMKFLAKYKSYFQELASLLDKNYQEAQILCGEDFSNFEFVFSEHIDTGLPLFENYHNLQVASVLLQSMFYRRQRIDLFQRLAKSSVFSGNKLLGALFLCHSAYCKAEINPNEAINEDLQKAENYLEQLRKVPEKKDEFDAVCSMYYASLGNASFRIGEHSKKVEDCEKTIEAFKKSCSLREQLYKEDVNNDISTSYSGLGAAYNLKSELFQGEEKKQLLDLALNYFTKSMKTLTKINKSGMLTDMPVVLQNIGTVYQLKEQWKKAESYFKQALKIENKLNFGGYYNTATIMCNLANVYRELGKKKKALDLAKQAVAIRTDLFGDHFKTVQAFYLEAVILHELQLLVDAIDTYKKAFEMNENLPSKVRLSMRADIMSGVILAHKKAINDKKLTYFEEDLKVWEAKYQQVQSEESLSLLRTKDDIAKGLLGMDINKESFTDAGMAKMSMEQNGGVFEFKFLGVSINVPEGALESPVELQLSRVPLSDISLDLAMGEAVLGDVILVGPKDRTFAKPVLLSIPYNLFASPLMTEIVTKHFVPELNKWIDMPVRLSAKTRDDGEESKLAMVEINHTGLYLISLVLRCVQFEVHRDMAQEWFYPFGEENDIKLGFQAATFGSNQEQCLAKVNIFTEAAKIALKNLGITTSPIIHIETLESTVPRKPVRIQLPFQQTESPDCKLRILQGNDEDALTDITTTSNVELRESSVTFEVNHFSIFLCLQTNVENFIGYLKTYVCPAFDTVFHLYSETINVAGKPFQCCSVASSSAENIEREKDRCLGSSYELIEKSKSQSGIYSGTKLKVCMLGSMAIDSLDPLVLNFRPSESCFTETFRLLKDENEQQTKDYVIIEGHQDRIKYGSIPYWKLQVSEECEEEDEEIEPPFRFLGLALQNCHFDDIRLNNYSNFSKFRQIGLPESFMQDLKALRSSKGDISLMKIALEKITETFIKGQLKTNWFENGFMELDCKHMTEKLSQVWCFLHDPITDVDKAVCERFLQRIYNDVDIGVIWQKFCLQMGFKHGDIENVTRTDIGRSKVYSNRGNYNCKVLLDEAMRDGKISNFLQVVEALLKTMHRNKRNQQIFTTIKNILDELGLYIETHLDIIDSD